MKFRRWQQRAFNREKGASLIKESRLSEGHRAKETVSKVSKSGFSIAVNSK
jgi:hypothetical protein